MLEVQGHAQQDCQSCKNEAARSAGLGWSDREYVAVIKRCKDMEVQGQRCKEGARTCTARV